VQPCEEGLFPGIVLPGLDIGGAAAEICLAFV